MLKTFWSSTNDFFKEEKQTNKQNKTTKKKNFSALPIKNNSNYDTQNEVENFNKCTLVLLLGNNYSSL